jgi:hypothetical protein
MVIEAQHLNGHANSCLVGNPASHPTISHNFIQTVSINPVFELATIKGNQACKLSAQSYTDAVSRIDRVGHVV